MRSSTTLQVDNRFTVHLFIVSQLLIANTYIRTCICMYIAYVGLCSVSGACLHMQCVLTHGAIPNPLLLLHRLQRDQSQSMDTEIESYKKAILKEQEENEQLTGMLRKLEADIAHVKKQIEASHAKREQLKMEYMTYTRTLQETEEVLGKTTTVRAPQVGGQGWQMLLARGILSAICICSTPHRDVYIHTYICMDVCTALSRLTLGEVKGSLSASRGILKCCNN